MTNVDLQDLRVALDGLLREAAPADPVARAKHRALGAAIMCEAFRRRDLTATLVGGGAIEFHAPGAYATDDVDLVVVGRPGTPLREAVGTVLRDLRFAKRGRHWVRGGMFVEVPGHAIDEPAEEHAIGGYSLRVVRPEVVLADRIVGFKHWRYTAYGLQAIAMLAALRDAIDEAWLLRRLEREHAADAYRALRELEAARRAISDAELRRTLERLVEAPRHARNPARRAGRKKRR